MCPIAHKTKPVLHNHAFSLIEIVLALGVVSVAALSLIGLLGVGLSSSREATEETAGGLVARYIFTQLETEALSAEDLSTNAVSPFNPIYSTTGVIKNYYFTREGEYLGTSVPTPANPARLPFFLAVATINNASPDLAPGVAVQGVSPKELRAVELTLQWPIVSSTGAVPATPKTTSYSFLLSKGIYRKSLEGER